MTWAQQQRMDFIEKRLRDVGTINRRHLMAEFSISMPQAAADIKRFIERNPTAMKYNSSEKRYERADLTPAGSFHCPICMRDTPHHHEMAGRWIGVDFDGTLATDRFGRTDPYELGQPISEMVNRVKGWLASGYAVKLMTARMCDFSHSTLQFRDVELMKSRLQSWCALYIGTVLECTNVKDGLMEVLWDDRAVRVIRDTGMPSELHCSQFKPSGER